MTRALVLLAAFCAAAPLAQADDWAYRTWIAKAGRTLRAGQALSAAQIDALAAKSPDAVVDELMAAPDFADAVLDFNLYFLGAKPSALYYTDYADPTRRNYAAEAFQNPQAIASAQAALSGGDFLGILGDSSQRFVTPFPAPSGSNEQLMSFYADLDEAVSGFYPQGTGKPADKAAGCKPIGSENSPTARAQAALSESGLFANSASDFGFAFNVAQMPQVYVSFACFFPAVTADQTIAKIAEWRASVDKLVAAAPQFYPSAYQVHGVADLRPFPGAEADRYLQGTAFDALGFWSVRPNSSTNYNRKRAAHMLKTYFCDDLVPINVVPGTTSGHAGDAHASDPSCQSCHYKLDPMAGFFKDRGLLGLDFKDQPIFVFDDNALFTGERLTTYRAAWPVTGYVRSTLNPQQNDYGSSLADLFAIIRQAPESKQCLTRRLAEYTLGRDQTVDGAWIDHMSQEFAAGSAAGDSTAALKSVFKELLLSKTFANEDPQTNQCYDYYPEGSVPELPCAVSFVIHNNCAACHHSTDRQHGGLDMTHWTDEAGFPHVDEAGNQRPKADSLARIQARLNSADPRLSMPLLRDMPATEKARLYGWVNGQLSDGGTP